MRYYAEMTKIEAMAALEAFREQMRGHSCIDAEVQLDTLIEANRELGRELAQQDHDLIRLQTMYEYALATIDAQREEIRALRAGARPTPTEMRVRRLGRQYHPERSER